MKVEYVIVVQKDFMEINVRVNVLIIVRRVCCIVNVLDKESVIIARRDLSLIVDLGRV